VGFVVDKVVLGQVFSEYFGFPVPIFIPPIAPQSPSSIISGWYNRPVVAAVKWTQSHPTKNKKIMLIQLKMKLLIRKNTVQKCNLTHV
jgi:hypothetical protein